MSIKILISSLLLICGLFSFTFAQSSTTLEKTTLIDEFPILPECDRGARMDNLMIHLMNTPNSRGYILIYRGAKDVLSHQSDRFYALMERMLKNHLQMRGYEMSKVIFVDAGFQDDNSVAHQLWIVPKGGEVPKPKDVVAKPKTPTDKAYLADKSWLNIYEQSFEYFNEKVERESDIIEYQYTEESYNNINELSEVNGEISEFDEEDSFIISESFIDELKNNKTSSGIIFYYADVEEYHMGNVEEFLRKNLANYSNKNKKDLSKVRIVYGGYRNSPEIEFWIVPQNAPNAMPTPEQKKIEKKK